MFFLIFQMILINLVTEISAVNLDPVMQIADILLTQLMFTFNGKQILQTCLVQKMKVPQFFKTLKVILNYNVIFKVKYNIVT